MTKQTLSLVLFGVMIACCVAIEQARVEPAQPAAAPPEISLVKPAFIKIRVEDKGSRVLTKEEANQVPAGDVIEAKPVVKEEQKPLVDLVPAKTLSDADKAAVDFVADKPKESILPPIPLQGIDLPQLPLFNALPPFVQRILSSLKSPSGMNVDPIPPALDDQVSGDNSQPKKILSILLMRHNDQMNPDEKKEGDISAQPVKSSSFFIFRFMPRFNKDDNQEEEKKLPLFGGDTDVDSKRVPAIHLLGGGGENDPDRLRFQNKGIFTGGDEALINKKVDDDEDDDETDDDDDDDDEGSMEMGPAGNDMPGPDMQHHSLLMQMFDRLRTFFDPMMKNRLDNMPRPNGQFIMRMEDGRTAILPDESQLGSRLPPGPPTEDGSNNKCLMLSFMRLKASMYYRTVLHLLFFSGVLLFVLFMIMLTIKSYKKRRYTTLRYSPHNMKVSTIDGSDLGQARTRRFKFLAPWSSSSHQLITSPDVKSSVLIQGPPGYDDVPYMKLTQDAETTSLPPEYESDEEKKKPHPPPPGPHPHHHHHHHPHPPPPPGPHPGPHPPPPGPHPHHHHHHHPHDGQL